jgi:hypothetical protein
MWKRKQSYVSQKYWLISKTEEKRRSAKSVCDDNKNWCDEKLQTFLRISN